ncbi:hypothetical protein BO70DRAFT_180016 [Aspergillus heteromorphus CBS 117.55]|uniref:Uncharacterized protein n=1 Tax=Aspergillus heteromorphus CBS 117.55 TaxID=1448321 RepID=A0A317WT49_9EURO|nr:uncharacterized protein BO70DRAFT_180016 [Aspergillus heteromorphus CBS 117.55]PWY88367.1 hypothetical protein BO70DRAFT_180016 [Aspergillus heteromorphus CBS 117.55]
MFEDFSFSSPSSTRPSRLALDGEDRRMADSDSALISPMSSRCPSPRSQRFSRAVPRSRSSYFRSGQQQQQQPPTSVPFSAYDHKRLSISTLTRKLHEHTLQNPYANGGEENNSRFDCPASPTPSDLSLNTGGSSGGGGSSSSISSKFPGYVLTPPDTDHDDESLTSGSLSPSPFLSPTSIPADFPPLADPMDLSAIPEQEDAWHVRSQRQQISRLQCNQSDIESIRRALVSDDEIMRSAMSLDSLCEDDCHPSSIPPQSSPRRRALTLSRNRFRNTQPASDSSSGAVSVSEPRSRRKSSVSSHRIEKNYHCPSTRELRKKSEQGLRRKSLVSAALASMVEPVPDEEDEEE